jgi:ribonucleoside-triphosphate reductase
MCDHKFKELKEEKVCSKCGMKVQKCEVYSRVVGYIRPVSGWNDSKQSEFRDRHLYKA